MMNSLNSMKYDDKEPKILNTLANIGVAVVLASTVSMAEPTINITNRISTQANQEYIIDYTYAQQTTYNGSTIKNNLETMREIEVLKLNDKIFEKFSSSIIDYWIPADGLLDKTCLFVTLKNQDAIISTEGYDFELDLYTQLSEDIAKSQFFNMIALM